MALRGLKKIEPFAKAKLFLLAAKKWRFYVLYEVPILLKRSFF